MLELLVRESKTICLVFSQYKIITVNLAGYFNGALDRIEIPGQQQSWFESLEQDAMADRFLESLGARQRASKWPDRVNSGKKVAKPPTREDRRSSQNVSTCISLTKRFLSQLMCAAAISIFY